jgi:hypothetical protein
VDEPIDGYTGIYASLGVGVHLPHSPEASAPSRRSEPARLSQSRSGLPTALTPIRQIRRVNRSLSGGAGDR